MTKQFFLLFFVLGLVYACKNDTSHQKKLKADEIQFHKDGVLSFKDSTGTVLKTIEIETAKTDYEQETGLMYRKEMKENRGMLFMYDKESPHPNFYMKNTYIGLDMVYINAEHKIVDIYENAKPLDESLIPSSAPAQYVLEINAGMVRKWGLKVGDTVSFDLNG